MKRQFVHNFEEIISLENLFAAWQEFYRGKSSKKDVQLFAVNLIDNIVQLHQDLANKVYKHGGYENFRISDPKPREIHKAQVRDRVLHHVIYRILYPSFDRVFISDSFSCRIDKGSHKAMDRFKNFGNIISKNNTRTCWILKCDVKKFFACIDQQILLQILHKYIDDPDTIWLLKNVIGSFSIYSVGKGLPLGNLTSQLFCNIYMNEFDQFVKHKLKAKFYVRYADDFVLICENKLWLEQQLPRINQFLNEKLKLFLHPDKIYLKTLTSGIDFLGWVHFPKYRRLRTATKKRMIKKIVVSSKSETLQSYLGMLSHGQAHKLEIQILNQYWINSDKML